MKLKLEQYSEDRASEQAELLTELVNRERGRLINIFPGTLLRYADAKVARETVLRISESEEDIAAYVVRDEEERSMVAHGIGTVIANQRVVHSELRGRLVVDDVDYWLDRETNDDRSAHSDVAYALAVEAYKDQRPGEHHPIIATHRMALSERHAGGFRDPRFMVPLALSGHLSPYPGESDPYGVTHDGEELEIYMARRGSLRYFDHR